MKAILTFVLSVTFQLNIFATQPTSTQSDIPPEVEALVDELRENLNAGELLQHSRDDILKIMRNAPRFLDFRINPFLIPNLTDDEIMDYITFWTDLVVICSAFYGQYSSLPSQVPYFCEEQTLLPLVDHTIETKNDLEDFLNFGKTHSSSLFTLAKKLATSRYYENPQYKASEDEYSNFGKTGEITLYRGGFPIPSVPSLQNDLYHFRIMSLWGYIAFEHGQARLLFLEPISN